MPTYKLTYFDIRGRGELIRYTFVAAGQDFEDNRIKYEDWPSIKQTTPYGQLPLLDVDGKNLGQSKSIARFLAREFGLAGKDSFEQAQIDQYVELADDLFIEIVKWFFEEDESKKKDLKTNLDDVLLPKFCGMFEKALQQNGGELLVGMELTLADLAVLNVFDTPMQNNPNLMDTFPKLRTHRERISSTPKFASYIKDRKKIDI